MIQYQFKHSGTGRVLTIPATSSAMAWRKLRIKSSPGEWKFGQWQYA